MRQAKLARKARLLRWAMNFYPPYLGAGVRIQHIAGDFREVRVKMGLGWYNRNYVGTQFGGSLYSMTDPFFMLMVMENLGSDYIVWDKAASIDFIAPGKGPVYADFVSTKHCSTRFASTPPAATNTCHNCTSTCMMATAPW